MANEITATVSLQLANGTLKENRSHSFQATQTVKGRYINSVNIGTSEETLAFPELTQVGYLMLVNLDATNYVDFGNQTGALAFRIGAGAVAFVCVVPGISVICKANSAAVELDVYALDA